jgi:hypothetical protein
MANGPELELQGAILARLKADPAVASLVAARIYDSVPQGATFPYVTFGPVQSLTDDADCITGLEIAQQIDVWSRAPGFPEAKRIVDAVRAALHDAPIVLTENALVYLEHRTTDTRRDPDGLTSHGIMHFEAFVERQPPP